jgi:hypothetical protein
MQDTERPGAIALENRIAERYGLLLSQTQLAELLGRTCPSSIFIRCCTSITKSSHVQHL